MKKSKPLQARPQQLFLLALALLLGLGLWQCRAGVPVSFDLMVLLPQGRVDTDAALYQRAIQRVQQPLSRQMLALVAHADSGQALQAARILAQRWQASGLFDKVELSVDLDLDALRERLLAQRLSLLPEQTRKRLLDNPQTYLIQRASELADPFSAGGLIPLAQDWLGLAQRAQNTLLEGPVSALRHDPGSDTLQWDEDGQTVILLRAWTQADAFDAGEFDAGEGRHGLAGQIGQDRAVLAAMDAQLLLAGGPLYAALGRSQAMQEISLIGSLSMGGVLFLLLFSLRHPRALLALLPVLSGLLCGFVTCVALFGFIHIFTLLIGASLMGVAVDFPLHWLGKSYAAGWQARPALRRVLPGLCMSLAASLAGYLALLFTPFIALTQTAVFSAAGLLGAFACTLLQLPAWFERWQPRPWPPLLHFAGWLLKLRRIQPPVRALFVLLLALGTGAGIQRLSLHDDLRQWLALPPSLLHEAQLVGEKTGLMPTSQFFLVQAPDTDSLLQRQAQLAQELDALVRRGELGAYNALSQLLAPQAEQQALQNQLATWWQQPQMLRPLTDIGIPLQAIQAELAAIQQLPPVSLEDALSGATSERWRSLWMGTYQGQSVGLVTLWNLHDAGALHGIAGRVPGVALIDHSGELNQLFTDTRVKAGELKLLSYLVAAMLLWWGLGRAAVFRILAVPLFAAMLCLAALGWLGQPLTLFSLFGLLLVSALGVDYAIFMYENVGGARVSLVGVLLSGMTTVLSFGVLSLSQTPAIAGFGLTVTLGIVFSLLLALWVKRPQE